MFLRPILALNLIIFVTSAYAVTPITLENAVNHALKNNPNLLATQQQVTVAHEQFLSVDAAYQPIISLSYSARISDNPLDAFADKLFTQQITTQDFETSRLNNPDTTELYTTSLSVRLPLYTGGKIEAQQLQSSITYKQRQLLYQRAQQKTVFQTKQAYLYVIAAHKALLIAKQATQAFQNHADSTAKLARQERIVESDKFSAQVTLSKVKSQLEQSQTRYKNAITRLQRVMGMPLNNILSTTTTWPNIEDLQDDLDSLYIKAQKNRADLLAANKSIDSARANIDIADSENNLKLNLVASSNWYDDNLGFDSQSSSLMAVASLNLYDGTTRSKLGSARAQHKEQQWRRQSLLQTVQSEVKQAFDSLLEAKSRVAIAKDNVVVAKKTVRLVKKRYGRGLTILLDLLQSEKMYVDARLEKLTSEFNLRSSQLLLQNAVGVLDVPKEVQH